MSNVEIKRGPLPGQSTDIYHISESPKKHYYGKLAFLSKQPADTITLVHEGPSEWMIPPKPKTQP